MRDLMYGVWMFIVHHPITLFIALAVVLVAILAMLIVEIITTDRNAGSGIPRR